MSAVIEPELIAPQLPPNAPKRLSYTDYSPERKAEVLSLLDANEGNIKRTANDTGIDHSTIRYWIESRERYREFQPQQQADLAKRFEFNAHLALTLAESKASEASYAQLMTGAAIATDKMQLLRNLPTSITEHVNSDSITVVLQSVLNELTLTD